MNKKTIITILLALVWVAGQVQVILRRTDFESDEVFLLPKYVKIETDRNSI